MEGWVDLSTAVKVHSPCSRLYIAAAVAINTTVSGVIQRGSSHTAVRVSCLLIAVSHSAPSMIPPPPPPPFIAHSVPSPRSALPWCQPPPAGMLMIFSTVCPVRAPGCNVPLIWFLTLALYIVCLFISCAFPVILFPSLFPFISSLTYLSYLYFPSKINPFCF